MKNLIVFTFPFCFFSSFLQLTDLNTKSESTTISTVSKNSQIIFLFFKIDKNRFRTGKNYLTGKENYRREIKINLEF
ncbi:hypothetical protein ATE47_13875 [Chryseobacterium sp. IHB B 17019]|uniref:hypothetical protein n=1 Tax=Chryseobacterium sp. IHB B 17019 TaxID=1721091 RepID=UPI0007203D4C|nr:hypothetical protein [Chryseobacterium sp. IHB B 17019]ALR31537.1 hypothetical protein ATE47_13875 [Chryseobacterium sp. IHB B 17019]